MGLNIVLSRLASREVRSNLTEGTNLYTMDGAGEITQNDEGGWIGAAITFVTGVGRAAWSGGGWLLGKVFSSLKFAFSDLWGRIIQIQQFIYNFNWQATDEQLNNQVFNLSMSLMSQLGDTTGNLMGWLVCGVAPAAGIFAFNEILGLRLLKDVGEEALDEFLGNLQTVLQSALRTWSATLLINEFKAVRNLIKKATKDPESIASKAFNTIGFSNDALQSWGEKGQQPWSFAIEVENRIDAIKNPFIRSFVEGAYEEFGEACIEAGYVVAGGLDRYVTEQRMNRESAMGATRIVEITPTRTDESNPDLEERVIIAGPEQLVRAQIVQTLATHQLIEHRDVGMIVGETLRDYTRASIKAPSTINNISLQILCFSLQSPPFWNKPEGQPWDKTQITIPRVRRSKLEWNTIRTALGGSNGFMLGPWTARGELVDDSGQIVDKIVVSADDENEAIDRLEALMTLSELEILRINCSKQTKKGSRGLLMYREPIRVYPGFCTVVNAQKILNEDLGRTELSGAYKRQSSKLDLWGDSPPPSWDAELTELLSSPGADI